MWAEHFFLLEGRRILGWGPDCGGLIHRPESWKERLWFEGALLGGVRVLDGFPPKGGGLD